MEFNPFDAGVDLDMDWVGIKSRLKAAMFDRGVSMQKLSESRITLPDLERAFNNIEFGDPEAIRIISEAAVTVGVSPQWVLLGIGNCPLSSPGQLIRIAWEYIYRLGGSFQLGKQFEAWLRGKFSLGKGEDSPRAAYREGLPKSVEDVARLYQQFRRDMNQRN